MQQRRLRLRGWRQRQRVRRLDVHLANSLAAKWFNTAQSTCDAPRATCDLIDQDGQGRVRGPKQPAAVPGHGQCSDSTDTPAGAWEHLNFNDRGDRNGWRCKTYTGNSFSVALSGWTHTRNYHKGYLRNLNGNGQALVSNLTPGARYNFQVYQYCSRFSGNRSP